MFAYQSTIFVTVHCAAEAAGKGARHGPVDLGDRPRHGGLSGCPVMSPVLVIDKMLVLEH